jgi:hypothetical protein
LLFVITIEKMFCYRKDEIAYIFAADSRGASCEPQFTTAEIRPVEPGQGNACAGKVAATSYTLRFTFAAFLSNQFFFTSLPREYVAGKNRSHEKIAFGDLLSVG